MDQQQAGSGDARQAWRDKPIGVRLAIAVPATAVIVLILFLIQNPDLFHRLTGPGFTVGDCVRVRSGFTDSEMNGTDCTPSKLTGRESDLVYRVDAVKDGKDAGCPGGYNRMTFSNEPEDTTYCLTLVTSR
jgi:hypothetical protein